MSSVGSKEKRMIVASETKPRWVRFTKRTDDPKLAWLEARLDKAEIAHRRNGFSFHAPIMEVEASRFDDAWEILGPVDDVPDDEPLFTQLSLSVIEILRLRMRGPKESA